MKKIFGNINITWNFLIIFSIILGIGVGVINKIPFLYNTSFQDIAIVYDMWIILAIFIIINCKSAKEAVLKCFIFFLISQPLIYFTEVLIETFINGRDFKEIFILYFKNYYIGGKWLLRTFLTIPGAYIAYQIKRNNILSTIILSLATGYLSYRGITELIKTVTDHFPYHLLNSLICLVMSFYLIFIILINKKERIIGVILTFLGIVIGILSLMINNNTPIIANDMIALDNNQKIIEYHIEDETIATASMENDGEYLNIHSSTNLGTTTIIVKDENNKEYIYDITSEPQNFEITKKEEK